MVGSEHVPSDHFSADFFRTKIQQKLSKRVVNKNSGWVRGKDIVCNCMIIVERKIQNAGAVVVQFATVCKSYRVNF